MTITARGRIPRLICASCISSALLISAGATTAIAATWPPSGTPIQQIARDDSSGGDSSTDSGESDSSSDTGDHPNTPSNTGSTDTGDQSGNRSTGTHTGDNNSSADTHTGDGTTDIGNNTGNGDRSTAGECKNGHIVEGSCIADGSISVRPHTETDAEKREHPTADSAVGCLTSLAVATSPVAFPKRTADIIKWVSKGQTGYAMLYDAATGKKTKASWEAKKLLINGIECYRLYVVSTTGVDVATK
ncbi:hypothetical protein ACGFX2_32665 [Streptomyces goshikiensis]|uniref:hypothetical protein n=1 Tax=Streptomyces goshikiensis TaxID=1942 RepID=UPI0037224E44